MQDMQLAVVFGDKLTSLEATSGVAPASKNLEVSFV